MPRFGPIQGPIFSPRPISGRASKRDPRPRSQPSNLVEPPLEGRQRGSDRRSIDFQKIGCASMVEEGAGERGDGPPRPATVPIGPPRASRCSLPSLRHGGPTHWNSSISSIRSNMAIPTCAEAHPKNGGNPPFPQSAAIGRRPSSIDWPSRTEPQKFRRPPAASGCRSGLQRAVEAYTPLILFVSKDLADEPGSRFPTSEKWEPIWEPEKLSISIR